MTKYIDTFSLDPPPSVIDPTPDPDLTQEQQETIDAIMEEFFPATLMNAGADDEARDDHGRWTSGGGGSGSGDVYALPVMPLDPSVIRSDLDYQMSQAIEPAAVKQANTDYPDAKLSVEHSTEIISSSSVPASSAKAMVSRDIETRLDHKYDTALLGNEELAAEEFGDGTGISQMVPVTSLLTSDHAWFSPLGADEDDPPYYLGKMSEVPDADKVHGEIIPGDDPKLLQTLRRDAISNLVSAWAGTSNDSSVRSLAMQDAATKEFGLKGTQPWELKADRNYSGAELKRNFASEVKANGELYQAFLRAQYDNTQQFFKDHGITEVTAYRGFDFEPAYDAQTHPDEQTSAKLPDWANPKNQTINSRADAWTAEVPTRPLSSFSYSEGKAESFAGNFDINGDGDVTGAVISGTIPVSRILSTAVTGLGCLNEREMVVLGGTDCWTVK